jgi:hypothetical protein
MVALDASLARLWQRGPWPFTHLSCQLTGTGHVSRGRCHDNCAFGAEARAAQKPGQGAIMKHSDHRPTSRHFAHHRLDAWHLAKEARLEGFAFLKDIPRGHGKLVDQARRALSGGYTLTSEGAARTGDDRSYRMRCARAEVNEAAAVFEAFGDMKLVEQARIDAELDRLWRWCAMLTGLARVRR